MEKIFNKIRITLNKEIHLTITMKPYFFEQITLISSDISKLIDCSKLAEKKGELIELLRRLKDLDDLATKDYSKLSEKIGKVDPVMLVNEIVDKSGGYAYVIGKIRVLSFLISEMIKKIAKENELTEKDKELLEDIKNKEDRDYIG